MMFGNRGKDQFDDAKAQAARGSREIDDAALEQVLRNFRLSTHAWSQSLMSQPRTVACEVHHRSWRLAAGLALSALLVTGSIGMGHERHLRHEAALQQAAARAAAEQRAQEEQQARATDRELLTNVDSDVSREVPSAMEPLAQLMNVSDTN